MNCADRSGVNKTFLLTQKLMFSCHVVRSELGWLAEAGEGCGLGLEDEAPCDPRARRVCSYYSPCDNKTTKREHPVTKHSYCKSNIISFVRVSISSL